MRVVHFINNLPMGGAERFLIGLAVAQARAGMQPAVIPLAQPIPLAGALHEGGIPVVPLGRTRLNDPRLLADAWRALRDLRPDVVHTHLFYADVIGRTAARLVRTPAIVSTEHSTERDPMHLRRICAMRATVRFAHRVVAVSAPVRDAAAARLRIAPERIEIIPNGVDLAAFAGAVPASRSEFGLPADAIVIGCIGRLVESKGFAAVLDAVASLGPESGFAVLVAGDGPERDALAARAAAHGLGPRVRFLGFRDDVPRILRMLDVFALPSRFEGHSIALLEALAGGCACIVGDVPELTTIAGAAALAVPPGDAGAIAQALRTLAQPARRHALARAAEAAAAPYDIDAVAIRYTRVYEAVLASR